jgi:hypothetical protein
LVLAVVVGVFMSISRPPSPRPRPPSTGDFVREIHLARAERLTYWLPGGEEREVTDRQVIDRVVVLIGSPDTPPSPGAAGPAEQLTVHLFGPFEPGKMGMDLVSADFRPGDPATLGLYTLELQGDYQVPSTFGAALWEILGLPGATTNVAPTPTPTRSLIPTPTATRSSGFTPDRTSSPPC